MYGAFFLLEAEKGAAGWGLCGCPYTLSEHARGWPATRWRAALRTTYKKGKRDSLLGICRAQSPSAPPSCATCLQKALSAWHTHALLPRFSAISRGYSYVVNHQGSQQGCPTIALWMLTFQRSLFTWATAGNHLLQILLCSSIPSIRKGVGQKAACHPGTQTSMCLMRTHLASVPRERTAHIR